MNDAVRQYVLSVVERHPQQDKHVLEFGSYNVNGTVRDLFSAAASYVGTDKRPGPGVDFVCDAHDMRRAAAAFETVLCLEMLEHDTDPQLTLDNAFDILTKDGIGIFTARGIGYWLHDEPEDYYRFTIHGLRLLMERAGFHVVEVIDHKESMGVFGLGIKRSVT